MTVQVMLAGEGRNELGDWEREEQYRSAPPEPGVVESLLRRVAQREFVIVGAAKWSRVPKLRIAPKEPPEVRNVQSVALEAKRSGATVLGFIRDTDGDEDRARDLRQGIARAQETFPEVTVLGGVARPVLEAWVLALRGRHGTEQMRKQAALTALETEGVTRKCTEEMVAVVERAELERVPSDAQELRAWIECARKALASVAHDSD